VQTRQSVYFLHRGTTCLQGLFKHTRNGELWPKRIYYAPNINWILDQPVKIAMVEPGSDLRHYESISCKVLKEMELFRMFFNDSILHMI
jgi:hypothetical protein